MEIFAAGTPRCSVNARVQRAESKVFVNRLTNLLRFTRRRQRSALSLPLCLSKA